MLPPTLRGLSWLCESRPHFVYNITLKRQCLDPENNKRRKDLIAIIDNIGEYAMKQRSVETWNELGNMHGPM
jgi:hypothetical protein